MITRRTVLKGMGIAPFLPYIGMGSAMATSLSDYAKVFKACRDARMNVFFNDVSDVCYEHITKMGDALRTLDMSFKITRTTMLDKWDFEFWPAPYITPYQMHTNIFNDVDVIILEDFAEAMPVVQSLILRHITTYRYEPTNKRPMFIITGKQPDKVYQRFHLYSQAANFVAFEV